ncbi:amino acid adenylation domain-containing protein [Streptomyces bambusae]|uniref:amino acid adenylation domain-containing protein n=1 Tax=Streptomyces bambusae TaxID=1550616 RepID=UPI001CFCF303|nr:amino acid adenylation domain-containing protein [Streptomyces bambusae]MCB5168279.1 amino acid adenylation domain-containing protein [Streptomyces bambusae]
MILQGKRVDLPAAPVVHQRFEAHAAATPDAVAVFWAGQEVTYAELNAKANRFAQFLFARGIGRGAKVGVCLDYSTDMLVAILGTLKAGAAYVPFDPAYPSARLQLLLGQVPDLALIVASPATAGMVETADAEIVDLQEMAGQLENLPATAPDVTVTGDDICYAVFTSGSTGTPKLTAVRHEGWFNLMNWLTLEYGLHSGSNHLVVSAFGFDLSQRSLMTPLFCGATQNLMASRNFDAMMAYRMLTERGIRVVHCASSTLYLLIDWENARRGDALTRLDYVLFGGEALKVERLLEWQAREGNTCTLLHQYGVAECTDVATSYDLGAYRTGEHPVPPVGTPAYNTDIHLLDEELRHVAAGEQGEICIAGASVGKGYLNNGPENAKFTTIEVDGQPLRVYRTGDRGHVNEAGELVVLGRIDAQVKVRGMRIDPTDIERALARLDGVREAAVAIAYTEAGEAELIAFTVPAGADLAADALRSGLLETLPRNMVPAHFVNVPRLPLSPHGKVDRVALVDAHRKQNAAGGLAA